MKAKQKQNKAKKAAAAVVVQAAAVELAPPVVTNRIDESFVVPVVTKSAEVENVVSAVAPVVALNPFNAPGRDRLTTAVQTWNSTDTTEIELRSERNALNTWDVRPEPLYLAGNIPSGLSMLVCTDDNKPLGTEDGAGRLAFNPKTYTVFRNEEMLGVIEQLLGQLDRQGVKWKIATTGSVGNRNKTFVSIRILDNAKFVVAGREFLEFIDCLNSFNKSCNITFTNSSICVCCANTFRMALQDEKGAFKVSIPHRKNAKLVVQDVPRIIGAAFSGREKFAKTLKHFSEISCKLEQAENIFAAFIGLEGTENNGKLSTRSANMVETLTGLFRNGKGNKGETLLDVFQAATEYWTHYSAGKTTDVSKQFESSEFGTGAQDKVRFFQALVGATESNAKLDGVARVGETILVAYRKGKADKAAKK